MSMPVKNNHIRYCPFCGKPFTVQLNNIRFCPFCGENLKAIHELPVEETAINSADAGARSMEQHDKAFFVDQPPKASNKLERAKVLQRNRSFDAGFYSLVLKDCSTDRQILAKKLQEILLRSPRAIQLALENIPCVMIYKGKAETVLQALTVFQDAGAAAILCTEDMNPHVQINEVYVDFYKLPTDLQIFMKAVPHRLWMGENIAGIYPVVTRETGSGALAVGEHALYFVGKQYDWLVVAYHQIQGMYVAQEAIEIEYHGGENTELFYFDNTDRLEEVFAQLQKAIEREQRRWQVEALCTCCSFHGTEGLFTNRPEACPQCRKPLMRKITDFVK